MKRGGKKGRGGKRKDRAKKGRSLSKQRPCSYLSRRGSAERRETRRRLDDSSPIIPSFMNARAKVCTLSPRCRTEILPPLPLVGRTTRGLGYLPFHSLENIPFSLSRVFLIFATLFSWAKEKKKKKREKKRGREKRRDGITLSANRDLDLGQGGEIGIGFRQIRRKRERVSSSTTGVKQ